MKEHERGETRLQTPRRRRARRPLDGDTGDETENKDDEESERDQIRGQDA